jgi:signal transduction histidine kinase
MRFRTLWQTTTFRLTALYGLLFALGTFALLGMVYVQSVVYLTQRVDGILNTEADALARSPRPGLRQRLVEELTLNGDTTNIYALFSADGVRIAGNLDAMPAALRVDARPLEIPVTRGFSAHARLIARRLPSGEVMVVGRDVDQLREMRSIITSALVWSGVSIILVGFACGTALSIGPLRRLRGLQAAGQDIARGDLKRRMPISHRQDELDMFAPTVNYMRGEVERLMSEVKGATDTIAHDLLTPLTRARTRLRRTQQAQRLEPEDIARVSAEIDEVLERFRAILRISTLDARDRRAGFSHIDLADIVAPVADLYLPLAEAGGVRLSTAGERGITVDADPKLLIEAVSNLVDNAIKFAGSGGAVQLRLGADPAMKQIIVQDDGPGIPIAERTAVLQRFYRSERDPMIPGSGLGLSVVAAIVRLHGFQLTLQDADPGVRAVIECRSSTETR